MKFKTIVIIIISVLLLIIMIQNTKVVELKLLFWQISMSRVILILLTFLVGTLCGFILTGIIRKHRSNDNNERKSL